MHYRLRYPLPRDGHGREGLAGPLIAMTDEGPALRRAYRLEEERGVLMVFASPADSETGDYDEPRVILRLGDLSSCIRYNFIFMPVMEYLGRVETHEADFLDFAASTWHHFYLFFALKHVSIPQRNACKVDT